MKASLWLQYAGYLKMPAMALSVNGVHFLDAGIYDSYQKCFERRFFRVFKQDNILQSLHDSGPSSNWKYQADMLECHLGTR